MVDAAVEVEVIVETRDRECVVRGREGHGDVGSRRKFHALGDRLAVRGL